MIQAEYIRCTKDILGDIEEIELRDIKTGKHAHVTPEQVIKAVQEKRIEIKYIKVSADGKLHITKRNKYTVGDKIKELESEIKHLEKSTLASEKVNAIRKKQLLQKLIKEKYKFKKYVASEYE